MLCMRHTPPIIQFGKILGSIMKMKHYPTVVFLSKQMELKAIVPNLVTLNILINCFCHLGQINLTFSVTLINGVCKIGETRAAIELLRMIDGGLTEPDVGISANVVTYNTLIHGFCKEGKMKEAKNVLAVMLKVKPDVITYNTLMDGCVLVCGVKNAKHVFNAMCLMENFLCFGSFDERIEVKRADVITYRSLLDVLCKNSLLDKAIGLFNKMKDHGVRPDVYIFTMLIDGMCKGGRLKNAKSFSRSFD
ncbi:hypothetical protein JHK85_018511 [Glycine max]|uniref:Pentatricopeptide repeat-containing protein, mitochondrial n=1 Tax=Glycine soja TaxID=3848 RepID=A0A0B2SK02_GLYSO|nr:hypothetical protein JHK85_018511 [Glycine max]KAG5037270.1 hypothetical protein JHK86_018110 [Glycine max]KHN44609.1 Pentatricopeptide repeat-containing protein, mitochondrial [Glycine soja]